MKKGRAKLVYLDEYMSGREFVLDRFTVADAYLVTVLNWTQATPQIDMAEYPALRGYLSKMRKRPSVAKVLGEEVPLFQAEIARQKAA